MVVLVVSLGYYLGRSHLGLPLDFTALLLLAAGTALSGGGACSFNQYRERDYDAVMVRTMNRPLPTGVLTPKEVIIFAAAISISGILILLSIGPLPALLAGATELLYVGLYTPLKRVTPANTIVGSVPGALPIVGGWSAGTGGLEIEALVLFAIMFFWQPPHFYSIATIYAADYARAGYQMLPVVDLDGTRLRRETLGFLALLFFSALLPAFIGLAGSTYAVLAALLSALFFAAGLSFCRAPQAKARMMFRASILYIPLLTAAFVIDGCK